jgi:exodeoxyribonuclease VII large subunit
VISSVGHHTDRTLIDDVAAVCCSTPTHAAEAAVPVDCRAARADLATLASRVCAHSRRAIVVRARALGLLSRAPMQHVSRHRRHLHQLVRELRASARRACDRGHSLVDRHLLVLSRSSQRTQASEAARRRRELERLALALAAHDPSRTLERGYALVQDPHGEPLGSAAAAHDARDVRLRFHDGVLGAHISDDQ